ncbi:PDR/VanB family oxidoreductase [Mycobacterium arosiense]|uniref:Oxidoreductase n=1 Tax=Mycobacterium arosiense ATCC BAA-1401 = DSM 45069 TaxID=1265311 RepID=A0A1W9ZHY4_MYCAI|nr:PDR/VanB family oxidoreductase [Mycobacterium arosiense]ORA15173.1 oxidoreductase [Mycobacterium arosiense ATCC BAA-1401 = DSM 45069]
MDEFEVVVAERKDAAAGVVTLLLQNPNGSDLPTWAPGAHIDVVLTAELIRQYSLCGDPSDRRTWRIAVLLEPDGRGGSSYVHTQIRAGDKLCIRGPRNNFALEPSPRYRFIAGGIGITPILPMIAAVENAGADWTLHFGGRTRQSMAFLDELTKNGQGVVVHPQDSLGYLNLDSAIGDPTPDTLIYCCGPSSLITAVEERCRAWPEGALHVERFQADPSPTAGEAQQFFIEIGSTGERFSVPADRSALSVLRENGIDVLSSCEEGVCGTCETRVISGAIDHRDSLLTDEEKDENSTMMVCVSRAASGETVVLDL